MNLQKIINFIKPSYPGRTDDDLVPIAIALDERGALAIDANTGRVVIKDPAVVRDVAPDLLRGVQLPTVADDADFDDKLANTAEQFRALGLSPDISGGGDGPLPFDPADLAKLGGDS